MFDFVEEVKSLEICIFGGFAAETVMLRKMDFLFRKGTDLSKTHFSLSKYPDLALRKKKLSSKAKFFIQRCRTTARLLPGRSSQK